MAYINKITLNNTSYAIGTTIKKMNLNGTVYNIGINTDDATAVANNILNGKTAYVKGVKITGTIKSQGAQTITPTTSNTTIASGLYLSGVQTIKGDANLKDYNIKSGITIFGINGTYSGSNIYSSWYTTIRSSSNEITFYDDQGKVHTWPSLTLTYTNNITPKTITVQNGSNNLCICADFWNINLTEKDQWFPVRTNGNLHWDKNDIQIPVPERNTNYQICIFGVE